MRVYLSYYITGRWKTPEWVKSVKALFHYEKIDYIDPLEVSNLKNENVSRKVLGEIVESDKKGIERSTVLVVYWEQPSVGVSMEVLHAFNHRIPVLVVVAPKPKYPPMWLRYHASLIIYEDFEHVQFLKILRSLNVERNDSGLEEVTT